MLSEQSRRALPTWFLLLLSGVLLGLAYPPNPIGLFGSIGLVPLLYALDRAQSYGQLIRWSYGSLVIFSALTSWWVGSWTAKTDPFLMISCILLVLFHPFFFIVPLVIYRAVRNGTSRWFALAFLPFLWCGGEYLHALTDASYPWLTLGNTQTYNLYYIQFIEFTGVWGLSFLLLVQNCAFTAMLFALDHEERRQRGIFKLCMAIVALTLVPPFIYGFYVLGESRDSSPERTISVAVIQPNMNPWDKWKANDTTDHIAFHQRMSEDVLKTARPDLFLWAENAIPYPMTQPGNESSLGRMRAAVDQIGVPVMTGFPDYMRYPVAASAPPSSKRGLGSDPLTGRVDSFRYDHFNSVGLFVPGTGLTGAYHKMQLVPFGERTPFIDDLPMLGGVLEWDVGISTWGKGRSITTFEVPTANGPTRAGSVICFESVYPDIVRRFAADGANFLTIVTNDGWYLGTPGPLQHERFALLRAIETRRGIARAANTGISCFITPYGTIFNETPEGVRTATVGAIELRDDVTLYTRWGDWWPQLCLIVAAIMIFYPFGARLVRRREASLNE